MRGVNKDIMKTVNILKPVDYKRWDDFVMNHQYGTIYHTTGWLKVLEEAFSIKPVYLYQEGDGTHHQAVVFRDRRYVDRRAAGLI